jgi:hypothetical protein
MTSDQTPDQNLIRNIRNNTFSEYFPNFKHKMSRSTFDTIINDLKPDFENYVYNYLKMNVSNVFEKGIVACDLQYLRNYIKSGLLQLFDKNFDKMISEGFLVEDHGMYSLKQKSGIIVRYIISGFDHDGICPEKSLYSEEIMLGIVDIQRHQKKDLRDLSYIHYGCSQNDSCHSYQRFVAKCFV